MVEGSHSCATRHSRIGGLLVMVAEVRERVAQVRICGRVPNRLLLGHALRLSDEGFQIVDANTEIPFNSAPSQSPYRTKRCTTDAQDGAHAKLRSVCH